jgi:uncharacterized alpha-E superfamily protein
MLLSRLAECAYWAARYLERAEATARLVKAHTELFLDVPRAAGVRWSALLAVTGSRDEFLNRHGEPREDDVVAFLAAEVANPGSIVASLASARENIRVTRSLLPRGAWEEVNQLYEWAWDSRDEAVDRKTRLQWMDHVIRWGNLLSGVFADTMVHDDCYSFLEVGRFVERADMTTRVLDVQSTIVVHDGDQRLQPYADVIWMGVLRCLDAVQVLRRTARTGGTQSYTPQILLLEPRFPRSVEHCLTRVSRSLLELPHSEAPMAASAAMQDRLEKVDVDGLTAGDLHTIISDLQDGIAELHLLLEATYFSVELSRPTVIILNEPRVPSDAR